MESEVLASYNLPGATKAIKVPVNTTLAFLIGCQRRKRLCKPRGSIIEAATANVPPTSSHCFGVPTVCAAADARWMTTDHMGVVHSALGVLLSKV